MSLFIARTALPRQGAHLMLAFEPDVSRRRSALLMIGFWRGFRSDELARLTVENTNAEAGSGITFYLPYTRVDRDHQGSTFRTPPLMKLCPVESYINCITVAGISNGPVFRKIDRWGNLSDEGFKAISLIPLLRRILESRYSCRGLQQSVHATRIRDLGVSSWLGHQGC